MVHVRCMFFISDIRLRHHDFVVMGREFTRITLISANYVVGIGGPLANDKLAILVPKKNLREFA